MNIVCLASDFKGIPFLRRAKDLGCHVTLLTKDKHLRDEWDWSAIDEIHPTSNYPTADEYIRIVTGLQRSRKFDLVCPMDEFDVLPAAFVRDHLQIEGQGIESAARFRDKLNMRRTAEKAGVPVPEFVALFNSLDIEKFAERVEPPWIVKPRTEVSAFGIRKLHSKDELWQNLAELDNRGVWRDHPSQYLLEKFIKGDVFHVDSVIFDGEPVFSGVSRYGKPPFTVTHGGGIFTTSICRYDCSEKRELLELNRQLIRGFGLQKGVAHAEFLQSEADGKFYLLEVASRVGGAYISDALDAATGVNLWTEWASVDISTPENPYQPPNLREHYAGVVLTLAKQETPDTSGYTESEIVYRIKKKNHVGFIVASHDYDRVQYLLEHYQQRFAADFMAFAPARERHDDL
jgi:biotin carboxylase